MLPFKLLPVNRKRVLLINDMSSYYSDNLKYVGNELRYLNKRIEILYAVHDNKCGQVLDEMGIKVVQLNSLKYFFYAMTSRVLVTNSGGISYLPLKKNQYVINTWHGGGAYKVAGIDMYEDSRLFRKDLLLASSNTNVFLSTNKKFTCELSRALLIPKKKFWEIGMPRNDKLLNIDKNREKRIKIAIGIKPEEKLVLYAPTYRKPDDNYYKKSIAIKYDIDSHLVCKALKERFGGEWVFAYRLHPCVENRGEYIVDGALDLSDYPDMQELLEASDVLINDFSSSFWDFMLTKKPCFMYAKDLEHYVKTTRVYTPVEEWPFPKSRNNSELMKSILEFDVEQYSLACKKHYEKLGGCESGCATKKVCNRILKLCGF